MRTLRPSSLSRTLALATPAVSLIVQRADAAFDVFIKFDTIKGESIEKAHFEWSEAGSFSFGIESPFTIGSGGIESGRVKAAPLTIRKLVDKASPQLFLRCATGEPLPTVTLELSRISGSTAPVVFYKMILSDVYVSNVHSDGVTGGDNVPTESIELNFSKISIVYSAMDPKTGEVVAQPAVTWNFVENTK